MLFAICAGARHIVIGDRHHKDGFTHAGARAVVGSSRFAIECLGGYGILVPLSWLLTEVLRITLAFAALCEPREARRN